MKTRLILVAVVLSMLFNSFAAAAELVKIDTCWMEEAPGFIMWYAKQHGWDKEAGIDVNMLLFNSGPAQMEALPSKQWQLGATSTPGYLIGAIRYRIYTISTNINEGFIQGIYAREDSPLFTVRGYNPQYPEVYGSPETVKGITVLYTSQTTVHYMVGKWLEALGLTPNDVTLINMEQSSAIPAFEKQVGDAVALWAPFTYSAENRGWKLVGDADAIGAPTTSMYVGDRDWCDKNPKAVAAFLRVHYRVVDVIRAGVTPELVVDYQKYMNDFCGMRMSLEDAKIDLEKHPFWTLEETRRISTAPDGGTSQAWQWQENAAKFFFGIKRFNQAEIDTFKNGGSFTSKFLDMLN